MLSRELILGREKPESSRLTLKIVSGIGASRPVLTLDLKDHIEH